MAFKKLTFTLLLLIVTANTVFPSIALAAAAPDAGLSLEVSPSPIVLTIKPGQSTTVDVKIFNAGASAENLRIRLQSFSVNKKNSQVTLESGMPAEVASWVTFEKPSFTVKAGERISNKVTITTPPSAGFSYSFAMVISRQTTPKAIPGQSAVVGSVAIFSLLNIDRPGAIKKLTIDGFSLDHKYYEYLPAILTLKLRNDGNSLLLPAGNVYIQRKPDSSQPVSVLPVNKASLYLLPGVTREFTTVWNDGLPRYVNDQVAANAPAQRHIEWNWRNSHFRIGKYVAKAVVIYNDGQRDVPVQAEISFWVVPWKLLLGSIVGLLVLIIGLVAILKSGLHALKRNRFKYRA